jgi:hypothetical protein
MDIWQLINAGGNLVSLIVFGGVLLGFLEIRRKPRR